MSYPKIIPNSVYGRVYEVEEGIFFPSVSTICRYGMPMDEFLLKWYIERARGDYDKHIKHNGEASEVGTFVHDACEQLMNGETVEIGDDPYEYVTGRGYYPTYRTTGNIKRAIQSFVMWYNENKPKPIANEVMLYSTDNIDGNYKFPFAGRCDLVAALDGELWMLDLKTSKKVDGILSMQAQLSMYKMLWDANNERKIDRIGIIWTKKDYKSSTPPRSVLKTYEYKYDEELVRDTYKMFMRFYDGFQLGKPKTRKPLPNKFKLEV